jgi:hypothetical protein
MTKFFDVKPEVAIFWYDTENQELLEAHSIPIDELPEYQITYPKLHKTIWQKLRMSALNKLKNNPNYISIYLDDYTDIPRGRIFYNRTDKEFHVVTGKWINDYSNAKQLIINEFNLQNSNVLFKVDKHWNIGHGWGTEANNFDYDFNK